MSLLESKFNLCVLEVPKDFSITQGEAFNSLKDNLFVELSPAQEFGHGWVSIEDLFKTDFTMEDSVVVNSIVGGYRYDKKSVPAELVKKLFKEKLKEREKEEGHKLEKEDKEILKEECKQLLLPKVLPTPKLVTWVWDIDRHLVYVDAKSMKVVENFMTLFTKTFKVPKVTFKNYGLIEDQIGNFLDWIWKNTANLKDTWINKGVTLDASKNTFQFKGPSIEDYLEEIESIKGGKTIKNVNIGFSLNEMDYSITLNEKNMIVSVESENKIEHESSETAIIDNTDRIVSIIEKLQDTADKFLEE